MTKKILLSAIAASVMVTSAMATYGSTMISYGTKDKAMGGTGIASANGAQSGIMNPAMIAGSAEEVSVNATYMIIDVTAANAAQTETASETDYSIVPTIAYVKPINKNVTLGLNVYGGAGLGVDYSEIANLNKLTTNLQILKVSVPIAYKTGAVSVGISPVLAQGTLDITVGAASVSNEATDTSFGYEVGAAFEVNKNLNIAAVYKSPISLTYTNVITSALVPFSLTGLATDELEQPAEYGLGVTYKMGKSTINLDYRTLAWEDATGYKDFAWTNQNIMAIGYEFNAGSWTARAGYSESDTPLNVTTSDNANSLNAFGFPAIVTSHITFGGSYDVSKKMSIDTAVVLASGEDFKSTTASAQVATNDQINITLGVNYKF